MPTGIYAKDENEFLEEMATRFCFNGKTRFVFIQRFLEANADLNNLELAEVLRPNLEENNIISSAAIILRDYLVKIRRKLANEGCDFGGTRNWQVAKSWLRGTKYREWLNEYPERTMSLPSLDDNWKQLLKKATYTEQMRPKVANTLDMGVFQESVPLGSNINFRLNLGITGRDHLLLLEKGTSGRIWCLCPSFFVPDPYVSDGLAILPQFGLGRDRKSFKLTGNPGLEQIVAVLTKERPQLDWLPTDTNQPPVQLHEEHLRKLLKYLDQSQDCKIFYTEYTVTP